MSAKIDGVKDSIEELRKELNRVKSAGAASVESARKEVRYSFVVRLFDGVLNWLFKIKAEDAKATHSSLEAIVGKIRDYEGSNNDKRLEEVVLRIREHTERKSEREEICRQLEEKKARLQKVIDEQVQKQRFFDDNLELRKHRREQVEYESESKRCDDQLKLLDYDEVSFAPRFPMLSRIDIAFSLAYEEEEGGGFGVHEPERDVQHQERQAQRNGELAVRTDSGAGEGEVQERGEPAQEQGDGRQGSAARHCRFEQVLHCSRLGNHEVAK